MKLLPLLLLASTATSLALAGCSDFDPGAIELISNAEAQAILEAGSPLEYAAESDKRVRIDGSAENFGGEAAAMGMGDVEMSYLLQLDPDRNAMSFDIELSAGFITMDLGMAQADNVVNIRFRDTTYVGRDMKAEDIFEDGLFGGGNGDSGEDEENFDALLSGNFNALFSEAEGFEVTDVEATEWEGRQAFRITARALQPGEDWDGDGEPDHGAGEIDLEYVIDARSKRPYYLESRGPVTEDGDPTFEATFSYGDRVSIDVTSDGTRFPFTLHRDEQRADEEGRTVIVGTVGDAQTEEVPLDEVEMRVVSYVDEWSYGPGDDEAGTSDYSSTDFGSPQSDRSDDKILARMRLDEGWLESGEYAFEYHDNDEDGLVSAGDMYRLEAPAGGYVQVAFYDLWADASEGGLAEMMPGFELVALLGAVGLLVLARRVKSK